MGWIFLIAFIAMIFGAIHEKTESLACEAPKNSKERKQWEIASNVALGIAIAVFLIPILYLIGWVWYFFCGGFLLFENQPFWDKVLCGLLSVALLTIVFGGIAIIFGGWNPDK